MAIYVISFNYALEKVIAFTRIPLASLTSIQKGELISPPVKLILTNSGAYILSPLQEAGRDSVEVGAVHLGPH